MHALSDTLVLVGLCVSLTIIFVLLLLVAAIYWCQHRKVQLMKNDSDDHLIPSTPTDIKTDISFSQNSGSGSGEMKMNNFK